MQRKRRDHNQARILPSHLDTDVPNTGGSEEATQRQSNTSIPSARFTLALEIVPLLLVVVVPLSVQAGVFSSMIDRIVAPEVVASVPVEQPADIKLLSAHRTPNQEIARGGGDIIVREGSLTPGGSTGDDKITRVNDGGEISLYTVREEDTLSEIAEMFGVNSNTILWANDISDPRTIQPGDTLVILPIVGVQHIVKAGDTLASIAKKYEANAEEIATYNRLTDETLAVGSTVVVPGGNLHIAQSTNVASGSSSGGGSAQTSSFVHPAPGTIKTQGIHGYNAVDFGGAIGTAVRSAGAGEVIIARSSGWNGGYGNYVVVKHGNGTQTLYAHLSRVDVGVGASVAAGTTIGALGNSGRSTGPHLHFEVRGGKNPF